MINLVKLITIMSHMVESGWSNKYKEYYSSHSSDWKTCWFLFNENKSQCPALSASDRLVRESLGWLKILYVHCSDCSPWHGLTFMVIIEAMGNFVILHPDLCWVFKDDVQRFVCQHVIKVTSHVERDKLQFFHSSVCHLCSSEKPLLHVSVSAVLHP